MESILSAEGLSLEGAGWQAAAYGPIAVCSVDFFSGMYT